MSDPVDALILDLLEWIGPRARPYAEVIDAWRTSCPRLPVWEEATDRGLLERTHGQGRELLVSVTASGREFLAKNRPEPRVAPR
jgi:D-3-phosphoglycerate dehydrogenase